MGDIKYKTTDFVIIGTGIAGLYTALKLASLGEVSVLTKEKLEDSNTQYAQGGIAAVIDRGDSWKLHMEDTLKAGAGICDEKAVEVLVTEGPDRVRELIKMGTRFDHIEGELDLTREGAHSKRRILHARGDATGEEIRESLTRAITKSKNISLKEENFMIDLVKLNRGNHVDGVLVWDNNQKKYIVYLARAVILASGGCGQVYHNTSNPEVTTGDGVAAAYRAGAIIMDMEFIQFHPTVFYNKHGSSFLISESLRGEGAVLRNSEGKRFMDKYHDLAELAPRDVVARAILQEMERDNKPHVWLDITHKDADFVKNRFPTIFRTLKEHGIDITRDWVPVVPAAHYMMGGVRTDTYGRTNLIGLYAVGEVACTGVHGANRLASNSLLEGLVFGNRIYRALKMEADVLPLPEENLKVPQLLPYGKVMVIKQIKEELKKKMSHQVGIIRSEKTLKDMIKWIEETEVKLNKFKYSNVELWELKNMLSVAGIISRSALLRKESRGGHFREDYPEIKPGWGNKHVLVDKLSPEGRIHEVK
ncbi:L-aspartate oxidase [Halothermothrix orenii]|uniref:L-aspartate oxidase n=1 Tax=Halothermothrix orenii (strain H 168 / OCM 544 / DSM 9562) TaxID=373903 RepID=B8D070_HALOH|nr:L-aspartate oxidase [Halothermothrix orenii]ACL68824.1 L-aspartate oxidase [Halothermothrix orenii H 168]